MIPLPKAGSKRIVIIGGGFGGITLVKKLKGTSFQIVLIDKNNYHTFQPLLYQVATGGLEPDSIAYPFRKIFQEQKNFFFRLAEVLSLDAETNSILTSIGTITYDYLVIASGSTNNFFGMNQLAAKAMPLKSITEALDLRSLILQNLENSISMDKSHNPFLNIVVVGGGPTGVETSGALIELKKHVLPNDYPEIDFEQIHIYLIETGDRLLSGMSESSSAYALKLLEQKGVRIKLKTSVNEFDGEQVQLSDGTMIPCYNLIWSAGVKGQSLAGIEKEAIGKSSRIKVDRFNKVNTYNNVYAIGDVAYMEEDAYPSGHPMVAQVAIQQAKNLAGNLLAKEHAGTQKLFKYKNLGILATIGRNQAVADFSFIRFQGFPAWFLWMAVHLMTLVGFRNRIVVFVNWLWSYFSYDRAIRLIIRPFKRP